ncbi:MAG: HIT domain-containing protein, partial [Patescibacteria group bacterium]
MDDCPFCHIKEREQERVLEEREHVFVILSDPRLVPGHLLVIPRRHVEKLSELDAEEREELFDTVVKYQEKILDKHAAGCDIRQNYRPF